MRVSVANVSTGDSFTSYRPFAETVRHVAVILGIVTHPVYTTEHVAGLCREKGVWVHESNANGQVIAGMEP